MCSLCVQPVGVAGSTVMVTDGLHHLCRVVTDSEVLMLRTNNDNMCCYFVFTVPHHGSQGCGFNIENIFGTKW